MCHQNVDLELSPCNDIYSLYKCSSMTAKIDYCTVYTCINNLMLK